MASKCPKCDKTVYFAEKVTSLGKDWHKFCLKCEHCNKTLNPGGHAEHDGKPYCHKPCYASLYGPKGVNIGGAGSYIYRKPSEDKPTSPTEVAPKVEERKVTAAPKTLNKASSITTFTGEPNLCPRCEKKVFFAEKVTSLGKDWHRPCLRCERCSKTLTPGGHAEHDRKPYCHKPCYASLYGPKGVNIGGAGSYIYRKPSEDKPTSPTEVAPKVEERKVTAAPKTLNKASSITTFTGEPNLCPRCEKKVFFAEKVTSLGKDWHRPCLRCERCSKTLTPGGHAEHDGQPYCHKPCYGILFGPKGVNTGGVGSYIYDKDPETKAQP